MEIFWLEANCHLSRYLLDFGYSTFKMIISNHTIHIVEEQQIFTSLYNNVHMTIMSSQIENYHSYILFCGFNYLNVYLYVLAVSCVPYD